MIAIAKKNTDRIINRAPKGGMVSSVNQRFYKGGWFMPMLPATPPAPSIPTRVSVAGFVYLLAPQAIDPSIGSAAFAMASQDTGNTYMVHRDVHGEVCCTCQDHVMRRAGSGTSCKHGRTLVDLGLIEATAPRVLPTFANRQTPAPAHQWKRFIPSASDFDAAAAALGWRD